MIGVDECRDTGRYFSLPRHCKGMDSMKESMMLFLSISLSPHRHGSYNIITYTIGNFISHPNESNTLSFCLPRDKDTQPLSVFVTHLLLNMSIGYCWSAPSLRLIGKHLLPILETSTGSRIQTRHIFFEVVNCTSYKTYFRWTNARSLILLPLCLSGPTTASDRNVRFFRLGCMDTMEHQMQYQYEAGNKWQVWQE